MGFSALFAVPKSTVVTDIVNGINPFNKTKRFTFSYEIPLKIRVPAPIVEGPLPAVKGDMD